MRKKYEEQQKGKLTNLNVVLLMLKVKSIL